MSDTPEAAPAGAAPAKADKMPLIALVAALVLAPAITFGVAKFVLIPALKAELNPDAAHGDEHAEEVEEHAEEGGGGHGGGGHGEGGEAAGDPKTYAFENMVVNLAGTMGTRYLKCSFVVTGRDGGLRSAFDSRKVQLTDVTLSVLSSLSLVELEEAGAKNLLRERLVNSYNQALGKALAEQVYFSDFVIQ
ncbi:flagellar basal body-associated FliL family protein [Actomonas aquatica]|uniref:Flagellar protein FliL n=1 Tax=Actomonas aquatica TaxID=2866162 RepID=A0ABZ1CFB2_9BACT|nr:flagellar basal body-associated FliL family protein [Opitutus sp. WL0086]WRQ89274.1 flagellar basal body-associated FliL family protein [Opitutus sp. WL0086]